MKFASNLPLIGNLHKTNSPGLSSFASPDHLDPEVQRFFDKATSLLCKWLGEANQRGPLPEFTSLPEIAPEEFGLSMNELLRDLKLVMDGAYQPSHPGALAHLDPPPLTAAIVAELICAGLNNNLLAEELSPSLSRLERKICQWFASRLGLPESAGGVAASGGSLSNLMALVVARHHAKLENDSEAVVLASTDAHVSLSKAIRVMGLKEDSLKLISTNHEGQICLKELEEELKLLEFNGKKCFAVVATAGTTVCGAIDSLKLVSELTSRFGIWLHIDAAIGGVFALKSSTAHLLDGIANANSITLNPQKVIGIPKTSSLLLVAEYSKLSNVFSTGLPYIEPAWEDDHGGELGLQGTRSAEVLKLWMGLRQLGENGIELLLKEAIHRRQYLESSLDKSKYEILSGPLHLLACTPRGFDKSETYEWSISTRKLLLENNFMVSRPFYKDRSYLKIVLGNPHTKLSQLDKLSGILNNSIRV